MEGKTMKRLLLFLSALALMGAARGQTTYRYWFDNNSDAAVTGTAKRSARLSINTDGLSETIHTLNFQLKGDDGLWTPAVTRFFLKSASTSGQSVRFLADGEPCGELPVSGGAVGVDSLPVGLHSYAVQLVQADGTVSSQHGGLFLRQATQTELAALQLGYHFDGEDSVRTQPLASADGLYCAALDVSKFAPRSTHTFGGWAASAAGGFVLPLPQASFAISRAWVYPDAEGTATVIDPDGELADILQDKLRVRRLIITETMQGEDFSALASVPNTEELTLPYVSSRADSIRLGVLPRLLCVTTTDGASLLEEYCFEGTAPNLMAYAPRGAVVESPNGNVVTDGQASRILLTDGQPLRIPTAFRADTVRYVRTFGKPTYVGRSAGWETIALPFGVQAVLTADSLALRPFASDEEADARFWLAQMTDSGFAAAASIRANVPYIIAMPNSGEYTEGNITGPVTFTATDADVRPTTEALPVGGLYTLTPTYGEVEKSPNFYALNEATYRTCLPGSAFIRGLRSVRPFEAYLTLPAGAKNRGIIPVAEAEATGIESPSAPEGGVPCGEEYYDLSGRRIIGQPTKAGVYLLKRGKKIHKVMIRQETPQCHRSSTGVLHE